MFQECVDRHENGHSQRCTHATPGIDDMIEARNVNENREGTTLLPEMGLQ